MSYCSESLVSCLIRLPFLIRIDKKVLVFIPIVGKHKIADVFTQLDLMEKRGSGFQKITTHTSELRFYCKDLAPSFESDASSFFTTVYSVLYGKTDVDFQRIIDQESTPKADNPTPKATQKGEDTTQKTTQKKSSTTQKPIGETAQKILDLLTGDPYLTRQAMASILNLTPDGVKYHLNKLQRDGYLERKEGRKTGRWIVLIKK